MVVDVRFKDHKIANSVSRLLELDMNVKNVDFSDITDYIVLIVYLKSKMKYTKTESVSYTHLTLPTKLEV